MCYLFCRCTRSISVVPPAQYAHLAAFRGRVLCRGGEQRHASAVHSLPWRPPERLFRSAPPTHCACPHAALRYACRAGDSETGSVSSGSGTVGSATGITRDDGGGGEPRRGVWAVFIRIGSGLKKKKRKLLCLRFPLFLW